MNTNRLLNMRRHLLVVAVAAFLAVTASYAPVVLDVTTGSALTTASFACGNSSGGC